MMKAIKSLAVVLVWTGAALAIHSRVILPYHCNTLEREVQAATLRVALAALDRDGAAVQARANLEMLASCLPDTGSVNLLMVAAANNRFLKRYDAATSLYQQALQLDRRPELYLNLGLTQIEAGDRTGVQNVIYACVFNPEFVNEVVMHRGEVAHGIAKYQLFIEELRKRGQHPRRGPEVRSKAGE